MFRLVSAIAALLAFSSTSYAQAGSGSTVEMSVLPSARSAATGVDVTFFATLLSTDDDELSCQPSPASIIGLPQGVTGTLSVYALDGAFQIEGARNAAFTIPAGGRRDLLVVFNLNQPMQGEVEVSLACLDPQSNFVTPRTYRGVNTFRLTVTDTPGPDIVMIGDTPSRDGVARVGSTGPRAALMTVAAINIGESGGPFEVYPDLTGFSTLERLDLAICELDAGANCLAPRADYVSIPNWAPNEIRLFAVFAPVPRYMGVPFWPDLVRLQATVVEAVHVAGDGGPVRPASSHREAPAIAETSSGISVAPGSNWLIYYADHPAALHPAYQCFSRHDADLTGRFENHGGILVTGFDNPGNVQQRDMLGYIWTRDFDRQPYPQPFRLSGFEIVPTGPVSTTMDLFGVGIANRQPIDGALPVVVTVENGVSIVIDWNGVPALENDFYADGLARCLAVPPAPDLARTPDGQPARTVSTLDGRYQPPAPLLPSVNPNQDANAPMLVANEGLISNPIGLGGLLLAQLSEARSLDPEAPGDIDILDAFAGFFAHLGTSGGQSVAARDGIFANAGHPAGFTMIANPADLASVSAPPGCLVILAVDGDVADVDASLDADANIMIFAATPEGEPVPDVTLADCLP